MTEKTVNGLGNRMNDFEFVVISSTEEKKPEAPKKPEPKKK